MYPVRPVNYLPGLDTAPTNPAIAVHDIAPGGKTGQRLWVLWQSDTVAQAEAGAWVIKNPKPGQGVQLYALPLDPQKAAVGAKVKPEAVALPQAGYFGGSKTVLQGFPVVAGDPVVKEQVWVGWLEADPGNANVAKKCGSGGQGGVFRLARLTGVTKKGEVDAAGEVCVKGVGNSPVFLTSGLAVLGGAADGALSAAQRSVVAVRPEEGSTGIWGTAVMLQSGSVAASKYSLLTSTSTFAKVHPVVVDLGPKAAAAERFLALGVTEKIVDGEPTVFALWGNAITDKGVGKEIAQWTTSAQVTGLFKDVTAVCGLDAAVDSAGNLGVVVVARSASNDLVYTVTRDAAGTVKATQVKIGKFNLECRTGISSARIVSGGGDWLVNTYTSDSSALKGAVELLRVGAAGAKTVAVIDDMGGSTDSNDAVAGPTLGLAWRGAAQPAVLANSTILVATEHFVPIGGLRSIQVVVTK